MSAGRPAGGVPGGTGADPGRSALAVARAAYRDLSIYSPQRAPCAVDLSDNTNRFGIPPAAGRALRDAGADILTRYPSAYAADLKSAIAAYAGVRPDQVVTGCGSDDVLDSAIRAFGEPGDRIAFPDPTFAMLPIFARMNGLEPVAVPLRPDFDLDADALLATGARILYLCSPNNPTGVPASRAAIERVVAGATGVVILDEAYAEFGTAAFPAEAPAHGRWLVARTLSKAFGLAGLRIGYATGAAELVAEVEKSRGPFKVGGPAERAAVAALTEDLGWMRARADEVVEHRARFIASLRGLGLSPLPSAANFVLIPVADAQAIAARMREAGVAVRPFTGLTRIGDAVRITIGPWELMATALAALRGALER